jgi:hypothetical protein
MRVMAFSMSLLLAAGGGAALAADKQPQPTDPMSSSRAPDPKPKTGNSTFDAPDKPPGPWGEIPGGGGPSGYNDGAAQKAPQYEGEKFKSAQQSERDVIEKPGGRPAPDQAGEHQQQSQNMTQGGQSGGDSTAKDEAVRKQHHQTISPGHLGPQGGTTADSGKAKHDDQARAEQEAAKSGTAY